MYLYIYILYLYAIYYGYLASVRFEHYVCCDYL